MGMLFLDLAVFAINIWSAVVNRGTIIGWISTAIVVWFVFVGIKAIREV